MNRRTFLLQTLGLATAALSLPAHGVPHFPGQLIVVENVGQGRVMFRVDPNSGTIRKLPSIAPQQDGPCVSTDGKTVLFAAIQQSTWQTWALDLATDKTRLLVSKSSWPIACLPDGHFIASGDTGVWTYDAGGNPVKKISAEQGMPMDGVVTSHGQLVLGDLNEPGHLHVLDLARGTDRKLAQGTSPSLAAQGTTVYFHDGRQFYAVPFNGGKRQPLRGLPSDAWNLHTSPDGRFLVWSAGAGKAARLVIAGPDLRPLKTIPIGTEINTVAWGP